MAILNGKRVGSEEILMSDRFIGSWRPPAPPYEPGVGVYICGCGHHLWTVEEVRDHWQNGHFDQPQYVRDAACGLATPETE